MQIVPNRIWGFVEGIGVAAISIRTPGFASTNPGTGIRLYRLGFITSSLPLSFFFVEKEIGER